MTTHTILTRDSDQPGHWKTDATLLIAGASREGGPGGWSICGWSSHAEGRLVFQGPMVRGPVACAFGLAGVIDTRGGTAREHGDANAAGQLYRVESGDHLVLDGITYELSLGSQRYPELTQVEIA